MDHEKRNLIEQLSQLGVQRGGVLVVHTAFSKVQPLEGGPPTLISALIDTLGPDGTLVMPSMSDDDEHVFDRQGTPCLGMGIVAEQFWRQPGVLRSDSPHAFAALGPKAAAITASHPPDVPHGLDSPIGRVWELDGQVLLIGVGHDANTTIHLAENMAQVRYGLDKQLTVRSGNTPVQLHYREIDHCCEGFAKVDAWLDDAGLQRRGFVGRAAARLARSRDVVDVALARLRESETVFLHSPGTCAECDESRRAIPA